ncbi:MAG: site-specific integrase [Clostridia bacterium]|nr:site-specific integrase [Clostridia bacterium]
MKYKYRHVETYNGVKIDLRANDKQTLHNKVEQRRARIDKGLIDGSMLLSEFGSQFLENCKRNTVSEAWFRDLSYTLDTIVDGIGDKPMRNIKPLHLQGYLNSLVALSDSTIKKRYDLIKQLFRHAYANGVTPDDYTKQLVRPVGTPSVHGRSITDTERKYLLQVLEGHRGELFCKIMLYCGLRPSEVQALQWKDINLKTETISVNKSMKVNGTIGSPKTDAAVRTVPIPAHLIPLLKANYGSPFDYIFSHNHTWRRRMWENVRREMNIAMGCKMYRNELVPPYPLADDFELYNLRHTYCTDLEKMGVPINIASRFMGHSSILITSKIYTHASTEALETGRGLINQNTDIIGILDGTNC